MNTLDYSFNLNPFNGLDERIYEDFDPEEYFKLEDYSEYVKEASEDVSKGNIFSKLFGLIKKIGQWLKKAVMKIVNGIRGLFYKKVKTPNQILRDLGMKKHEVKRDAADPNDPNTPTDAAWSLTASLIEGFADEGILFNPAALVASNPADAPIRGKPIYAGGTRASQVLALIKDPTPLDEYIVLFKRLTKEHSPADLLTKKVTRDEINKLKDLCSDFFKIPSKFEYAKDYIAQRVKVEHEHYWISIYQFLEFQNKVDEICKLTEDFDDQYKKLNLSIKHFGEDTEYVKKLYMDILNQLAWVCVNLQGGLHAIANGMQGVYYVDPGYWGCIHDLPQLAKFVEECMKTGIPGKYLVNNIYNVCDKSIKGNPDRNNPIMGFGRLTLLPKGQPIIYKIAINRYGVRSNKNDYRVMDAIKDQPFKDMFAFTTQTFGDYTINVMEKVNAGKDYEPSPIKAIELGETINGNLERAGIKFKIHDIKPDAFGQKNGHYVILDYGYLHRVDTDPQVV